MSQQRMGTLIELIAYPFIFAYHAKRNIILHQSRENLLNININEKILIKIEEKDIK